MSVIEKPKEPPVVVNTPSNNGGGGSSGGGSSTPIVVVNNTNITKNSNSVAVTGQVGLEIEDNGNKGNKVINNESEENTEVSEGRMAGITGAVIGGVGDWKGIALVILILGIISLVVYNHKSKKEDGYIKINPKKPQKEDGNYVNVKEEESLL